MTQHRFWDLVAEVATPDVLRDNPFRILDVPTDASAREVRRAAERLKVELGLEGAEDDRAERIEEAQRRLRDPDQRLIAELLWHWPEEVEAATIHNRAVAALQDFAEKKRSSGNCGLAIDAMAAALGSQAVATYVVGRAEAIGDPRLTTEDARQLLQVAELLVPLLALRVARDRHEQGRAIDRTHAQEFVEAVRSSSAQASVVRDAGKQVIGPALQRVRAAAGRAVQAVRSDAAEGVGLADGLLEQTAGDRGLVALILEPGDPQRVGLDDVVADRVLTCVVACHNQAEDAATALVRKLKLNPSDAVPEIRAQLDREEGELRTLRRVSRETSPSSAVRSRLDTNLTTITEAHKKLKSSLEQLVTSLNGADLVASYPSTKSGVYRPSYSGSQSRHQSAGTGTSTLYRGRPTGGSRPDKSSSHDVPILGEESGWVVIFMIILVVVALAFAFSGGCRSDGTNDESSSGPAAQAAERTNTTRRRTTTTKSDATTTERPRTTNTTAPPRTTTTAAPTTTTTAPPTTTTTSPPLAVGQCARPTSGGSVEYTQVSCDDPSATVQLIEKLPGQTSQDCPVGTDEILQYTEYSNGQLTLVEWWCMRKIR